MWKAESSSRLKFQIGLLLWKTWMLDDDDDDDDVHITGLGKELEYKIFIHRKVTVS
jgi:hypothetical protein